jgi:glucoamylase
LIDHILSSAPGSPGISPRWTSSAKTGIGTALTSLSRVWFTISHGILNEIYYPRVDQACTRDLGLLVTDGKSFFSEEKRHTHSKVELAGAGIPAYRLTNTCLDNRYQITKEIITDPRREVLLQRIQFIPKLNNLLDYHLYVLLAPHLGNLGMDNSALVDDYKGIPMLMAEGNGSALVLACTTSWLKRSAGFVGFSDGWQDIQRHKLMEWQYDLAGKGNVALTGEVDLTAGEPFILALGFGRSISEAAQRARASLLDGFDTAWETYLQGWQDWQQELLPLEKTLAVPSLYRTSASVLRVHEAKSFPGGLIASLSLPWGDSKGDDDLGGYHLVWPRDLVEIAGGLLAAGAHAETRRILDYLRSTQEADGHWPQNMWLDGTPYWSGVQMDETAFPILLLDLALRQNVIQEYEIDHYWPMVRLAASYMLVNGPVTAQDRWEEDAGFSPFTLGVEIAALLIAADMAEKQTEFEIAQLLRETADAWNVDIERWTYVTGTDLASQFGIAGYYVRIGPPNVGEAGTPAKGFVPIKNRPPGESTEPVTHIVSPDALALVRFGLRAPDDPRILNTLKVIDGMLKCETPAGPAWYRYNDDGYGEHEDGSPYDGTGIGRPWPLLTGERAHYELAAGRPEVAAQLLNTMASFSNEGGMLPEQVWDSADIPAKELYLGHPSGSAMPLAWAHAEYIKLCRSLSDGRVFDMPPQPVKRYQKERTEGLFSLWQLSNKRRSIPPGSVLRIGLKAAATIRWWTDINFKHDELMTRDTHLGFHIADLPTHTFSIGTQVIFTILFADPPQAPSDPYQVTIEDL